MKTSRFFYVILSALLFASCRDPYLPPVIETDSRILVVEGVLDVGGASTSIRLSRSTKLDTYNTIVAENGATVTVESESGGPVQSLPATGGGFYRGALNLTTGQRYRVRIRTNDNLEFLSEYTTAKNTPPIDSVGWKRNAEGITVHVNAHDNTRNTTYYKWEYEETWEIWSRYYAFYYYENQQAYEYDMVTRFPNYQCWKYNNSSQILIGSTARLGEDRVSQAPLAFVPTGDERMTVRYSILVKQYALEKNAYEFYDLMKKNTENIGTIFDPQPSEIRGNFTCITDPARPVIGFVTASTVEEKRIFINASEVPDWVFSENCPEQQVTPDSVVYYFEGGGFMPYEAHKNNDVVEYYISTYASCVDCTKRGGSLSRPGYW